MSQYVFALAAGGALLIAGPPVQSEPTHAIAMHGAAREPAGFLHFPYVTPGAPKGGRITLGVTGSFDSINPMIVKGEAAAGVRDFVIESLMARGQDEPFTLYPLLAESVDVAADRSAITFTLNPEARFADGAPVTADDVIFSIELLRERGRPNHRTFYKKVAKAERLSDRIVRLTFSPSEPAQGEAAGQAVKYDREMPLIMGLMPVLPKHKITLETFERTSLEAPLGSGPYLISKIDPGRSITYTRRPDYWGKDLPVNRGRYNFDEVRYDYFLDAGAQFEAFKNGQIDLRGEDDPVRWASGYRVAAVDEGRIIKSEFGSGTPAGMSALVFNTRRAQFKDQRVRQALIQMFNFEWVNRTLFYSLYKRTQSFFERSRLASIGGSDIRPADEREKKWLSRFPGAVRPEIMDGAYRFPVSDGTGHNRESAKKAFDQLTAAGYALKGDRLVHNETGKRLEFEILAASSAQVPLLTSFANDLKRLGVAARVRVVDSAQYQSRLKDYDYDMIQASWAASLSPGNEQLFRWSSAAAKTPGTFNYAGVENPAADAMIAEMLGAAGPEDFTSAVRALDRVLLSGDYVIPLYHGPKTWIAHWRRLKHPDTVPLFGFNLDSWWIEDEK